MDNIMRFANCKGRINILFLDILTCFQVVKELLLQKSLFPSIFWIFPKSGKKRILLWIYYPYIFLINQPNDYGIIVIWLSSNPKLPQFHPILIPYLPHILVVGWIWDEYRYQRKPACCMAGNTGAPTFSKQ